jgi:hypothetical protein
MKCINVNGDWYELSDIKIPKLEQFENVYFYKWYNNKCHLVFKEFDINELIICDSDDLIDVDIPKPHNYTEPWYIKILNYFKKLSKKLSKNSI